MPTLTINGKELEFNQGDTILAGESPVIWKVILTYIVPFCVATYGAYSACVAHAKMMKSPPEGD